MQAGAEQMQGIPLLGCKSHTRTEIGERAMRLPSCGDGETGADWLRGRRIPILFGLVRGALRTQKSGGAAERVSPWEEVSLGLRPDWAAARRLGWISVSNCRSSASYRPVLAVAVECGADDTRVSPDGTPRFARRHEDVYKYEDPPWKMRVTLHEGVIHRYPPEKRIHARVWFPIRLAAVGPEP